jgi:hypothetical protein
MAHALETPDNAARRHLASHHQVISHREAIACGLTDRQIRHRVQRGEWIRLARGVFCAANSPDTLLRRARAALVAGPPGTVVSHLTAAALFGLAPAPVLPHISIPPSGSGRVPLGRVHRSRVPGVDRATREGLACTSAARTLVDCAALVTRSALEDLVDAALCDRLATPGSVTASLGRAGRRAGQQTLLDVLEVWSPTIRPGSPGEIRLLRRLEEWGLPRPVCQHEITDGEVFVARVDVAWPQWRVALEYDGRATHGPRRWEHDHAREERASTLGWRFGRVSKLDLMPGEDELRYRLDRLLAGRAPRVA